MTAPVFAAAQQTQHLINREQELKILQNAVCAPGSETRVVIIEAPGGLGKTRLLNEALYRAGNHRLFPHRPAPTAGEDWGVTDRVIAGNPLDFMETRLHTFDVFKEAMRDALNWHRAAEFPKYDAARNAYHRRQKDHVDYWAIKAAADEANKVFFEEYRAIAKTHRLVWALDTAEQLIYWGALWIKDLLTSEDLDFSARDQVIRLLKAGDLPNTTILLAGRPEAEPYFNELIAAANGKFSVTKISLDIFSPDDVKKYLDQLAHDYEAYRGQADFDPNLAETLQIIAADTAQIAALHRYTGGQPVRLALFTDVLAEGKEIPAPLLDEPAAAQARLKESALETVQAEIEAEFIRLIFEHPGDLRTQILTALARARRGLDVKRLHFVLGSKPGETSDRWTGDSALKQKINDELNDKNPRSLRYLSFVKKGFQGRLILQDEMYLIFDRYMARTPQTCQVETAAREMLYEKLRRFAKTEMNRLKAIRQQNRAEDEKALIWRTPAEALSRTFRYLGEDEEERRADLEDELFEAEMERLHYKLRLVPDVALNDWYLDLSEQRGRPGDLAADIQGQIELLRFIRYDQQIDHWRKFIKLDQKIWDALEDTAEADEATRWIKRVWLRKQWKRGVELADALEQKIKNLPDKPRAVLEHPFFRSERAAWKAFCQAYLGENTAMVIFQLKKTIEQTVPLLADNFIYQNQFGLQPATANNRLRQIIGNSYNTLGYLYTTRGEYRLAANAYQAGLRYLRDTGFLTLEAVTRNNLSRVLSELGLITRASRICRDALEVREKLGFENPIASSYSTLALIYNNGMQPENAWVEAAKAAAYFRKLQDTRGLGLALHHLAEALRRLALSPLEKIDYTPEQLFDTAREAISEAVQLFEQSPEIMRRLEVYIEQGCLYRDHMRYLRDKNKEEQSPRDLQRAERYFNDALKNLNKAVALAEEHNFPRHRLDAQVNIIWTYFYAGKLPETEAAFDDSLKTALALMDNDQTCLLSPNTAPPQPHKTEPYRYMLLGKAWTTIGSIWMDRFEERQKFFKQQHPSAKPERTTAIHQDAEAQQRLAKAADAFVQALAYNKLYSIRSPAIPVIFNMLYGYLKGFNQTELQDFYRYQDEARSRYRVEEIKPIDLSDMKTFLDQSFGDYLAPLPGQEESDR
jgi:hypothetical protein